MKLITILIIAVAQLVILIITKEAMIPYTLLALIIMIEFGSKLIKIYKQ